MKPDLLTRINRKYETRKSKYETNPKFKNSNVSNEIAVATKLNPKIYRIFIDYLYTTNK